MYNGKDALKSNWLNAQYKRSYIVYRRRIELRQKRCKSLEITNKTHRVETTVRVFIMHLLLYTYSHIQRVDINKPITDIQTSLWSIASSPRRTMWGAWPIR